MSSNRNITETHFKTHWCESQCERWACCLDCKMFYLGGKLTTYWSDQQVTYSMSPFSWGVHTLAHTQYMQTGKGSFIKLQLQSRKLSWSISVRAVNAMQPVDGPGSGPWIASKSLNVAYTHIYTQTHTLQAHKRKKNKNRVFIGCPETIGDQTPTAKRAGVI